MTLYAAPGSGGGDRHAERHTEYAELRSELRALAQSFDVFLRGEPDDPEDGGIRMMVRQINTRLGKIEEWMTEHGRYHQSGEAQRQREAKDFWDFSRRALYDALKGAMKLSIAFVLAGLGLKTLGW